MPHTPDTQPAPQEPPPDPASGGTLAQRGWGWLTARLAALRAGGIAALSDPRMGGYALAFLIGAAGSAAFVWARMPLPIFLGALTFTIIASVLSAPIERPKQLSLPMRAILGVAVGTAFTPEIFARVPGMAPTLALMLPWTALVVLSGVWFFERFARYDRPTAFFCSVPGGLTDMVTMAADAGAKERAVTLTHAIRITLLVFLVPIWLKLHDGIEVGGKLANVVHAWQMPLIDWPVLLAMGVSGVMIAQRLGIAGAPLVGPMLVSGLAHAFGFTASKVPIELLVVAQVTLGILLGCQFRGITAKEFASTVLWGIVFSAALVAVTIVVTLAISAASGHNSVSILLAFAPGGQNELNLLAFILGLDVAFIALHHLVRLAIVIIGAQIVFMSHGSWRRPRDDGRGTKD